MTEEEVANEMIMNDETNYMLSSLIHYSTLLSDSGLSRGALKNRIPQLFSDSIQKGLIVWAVSAQCSHECAKKAIEIAMKKLIEEKGKNFFQKLEPWVPQSRH